MPVKPTLGPIGDTLDRLSGLAGMVGGVAPGTAGKVAAITSAVLGWAAQLAQAGVDPEIHVRRIRGHHAAVQEALDRADAEQARLAREGPP